MESQKKCNMSEILRPEMPEGMALDISHHPLTMKHVANLIIATERMKAGTPESLLSAKDRDVKLFHIMRESVVEECVVLECHSNPPKHFLRTCQHQCSVTDTEQRNLVRDPNTMELNAVTLQAGSENHKVHLTMSTYVHPAASTEARPVALCIKDTNFYLSCHMKDNMPTLHLEVSSTQKTARGATRFSADSDMVRFLFYTRLSGLNITTFMSARYPGWYISTAEEDNKPVEMCTETDSRYRTFQIPHQWPSESHFQQCTLT
uniref:Interleukin-1 n=1 Tax=Echeneis naucrates TaxID=173247 RepID=A0A665USL2_ECHNA